MRNMVVTFGEIMGRLAPLGHKRIGQSMPGQLETTFAGAEANVAVSLARLGSATRFVTALPNNSIGRACVQSLRAENVETRFVQLRDYGRMGLYFVESGANQRPSQVVYDRDYSTVSMTQADDYPWEEVLQDARWLHVTGITPAISQTAAEATLAAVIAANRQGVTVSTDLNFRKKLWRWDAPTEPVVLAQETMRKILPYVHVVIGNEEDAALVLDIHAGDTDVESGRLSVTKYPDVARQIARQFDNVSHVAITLRESISASHNNWGAMLYEVKRDQAFFAPRHETDYRPYEIRNIVDRVGAGDSFAAALIHALTSEDLKQPQEALDFSTAASCLAHSILGDFNLSSRAEVESLMRGASTGRVVR